MRALTIVISVALATLIATDVLASTPAKHTCRILTGYGEASGKGTSMREATENARLDCGTRLIDDYLARRGSIPADVEDDLALACVNLECSK